MERLDCNSNNNVLMPSKLDCLIRQMRWQEGGRGRLKYRQEHYRGKESILVKSCVLSVSAWFSPGSPLPSPLVLPCLLPWFSPAFSPAFSPGSPSLHTDSHSPPALTQMLWMISEMRRAVIPGQCCDCSGDGLSIAHLRMSDLGGILLPCACKASLPGASSLVSPLFKGHW